MSFRRRRLSTAEVFRRASIYEDEPGDLPARESTYHRGSTWTLVNGRWCLSYDDGEMVTLIHSKHEIRSMQDFGVEIRPFIDVSNLIDNLRAVILLDLAATDMDSILNAMLAKLIQSNVDLKAFGLDETKASLLLDNSGYMFSQTIQGLCSQRDGDEIYYDQSWICAMAELACLERRCVAIARLDKMMNLGDSCRGVRFVILIMCPCKEKATKTAFQTGLTFATLFVDANFRQRLLGASTAAEFAAELREQGEILALELGEHRKNQLTDNNLPKNCTSSNQVLSSELETKIFSLMEGVRDDFSRRLKFYFSDFLDGFRGKKTIRKVLSTTCFLYFACLLPAIAFGSLNDKNTNGKLSMYDDGKPTHLNVRKVIFGQMFGGIFFALLGGQPLLVLLTTAPLSLFTKVVYDISRAFELDFFAFFAAVGLFNSLFVACYAIFDLSKIMRWCTRSTEEIFALFITIAFIHDAVAHVQEDFGDHYFADSCHVGETSQNHTNFRNEYVIIHPLSGLNSTSVILDARNFINDSMLTITSTAAVECNKASSVLYVLIMLTTLWLGLFLYNMVKTPFLQASRRELLAEYALPIAVLFASFLGSYVFREVQLEHFYYENSPLFELAPVQTLTWGAILGAAGIGFCLSLLFFMDQNISAAMVNNPTNRLKKGPAYHLDLLVVALLNAILSLFSLPWMHAAIPHCPLHARSLADIEERVEHGRIEQCIVKARETRVTSLVSHVLIGLSMLMLPLPLAYIPNAVLDGLFLYMAITGLYGNQLFDRILLMITEQNAYPPNHYIRRVPQSKIHLFTGCQLLQLALLCIVGFSPLVYMKMAFPVVLFFLIPIRYYVIPRILNQKFLQALDGD